MTIHNMKTLLTIVCLISIAKSFSAESQRLVNIKYGYESGLNESCKFYDSSGKCTNPGCGALKTSMRIILSPLNGTPLTDNLILACVRKCFEEDTEIIKKAAAVRGITPEELSIYVFNNKKTYTREQLLKK